MKLHHLKALLAIGESGSFTGAATALEMSQSSLSHAIAEFERELGVSLLARDRRGARLTEVGTRISAHARQALATVAAIQAEADSTRGMLSGRIRIGSIPSAAVSLVPKVVAHFSRRHPGVEIVLLEEPSQGMQQLTDWLRSGMIDIALVELPIADLKAVPLMADEFCLIAPARSQLATRGRISVRELASEPFIMSRYVSERLIRRAYARHKIPLSVRFDVQDLSTLVSLVREGLGISIVPRVAFPETPPGVALLPVLPQIRRELGFAVESPERASPALAEFVRALRELSAGNRRPSN
ncbi:MAG TPA: LysR family transcriptional regulator [Steroidobacteraceae bacterium]